MYARRVAELYTQAPLGIIASLVNGPVLTFVQWDVVSKSTITAWIACLVLVNLLWCGLVYEYRQPHGTHTHIKRWGAWFLIGNTISGLVWGALAVFVYPHESTPHQIFLALVIGGMVAGSTAIYSASKEAFLAYILPASIPIVVRFFIEGDHLHVGMGVMGVVFLGTMWMTMRRNYEVLTSAICLQLENSTLVKHLADERDRAKALNQKLSLENQHSQAMEIELIKHRNRLELLVEERTAELWTAETRFQTLSTQIKDIIWMMKIDGSGFSYVNSAVESFLGYTAEEVTSRLSLVEILTPDSLKVARLVMEEELAKEHEEAVDPSRSWTIELEHYRKDGSTVWAEVRGGLLRDEHGVPCAFAGVTRDLTERKKIEKEKQQLEEHLSRSQKMEAIGTLAGGIAHDFNNLLTGVLGNISLSKDALSADHSSFSFLQRAEHESHRAKNLVQQLLAFSTGGEPIKRLMSVDHLVKNSVGFALSGSAVVCQYIHDEPPWPVEVDADQITQAFHQLALNAIQAMPNGGNLTVQWKNLVLDQFPTDNYALLPPGSYVNVSFIDNGMGIAPDHVSKVFDPYFTTKLDRHGLGLTATYTIIKRHGGHMTVDSKLGKGTCFSLFFPAYPEVSLLPDSETRGKQKGQGKDFSDGR